MDIQQTIHNRQSIRAFQNKPVEKQLIEQLLSLCHKAPSAGNLQARDFIIIDDHHIKQKLSLAAHNQQMLLQAPVVIAICANLQRIKPYGKRGEQLYCIQDATAAVDHLLLLATSVGLATCWIGAFDEKQVQSILHLPLFIKPVALIPMGYADEQPKKTKRIPLPKLVHYNTW